MLRFCRGPFIKKEDHCTVWFEIIINNYFALLDFFHCFHLSRADFALLLVRFFFAFARLKKRKVAPVLQAISSRIT